MRRGRPPEEFEERHPFDHFAWCSHKTNEVHRNEDLHYARWRLRCAGAISFILDTNPRPWLPADLESIPVRAPGLHMLTDANEFEAIAQFQRYMNCRRFFIMIFNHSLMRVFK